MIAEPLDAQMLDVPGSDFDIAMQGSPQYWPQGEERSMEETMEDADVSVLESTTNAQDVEVDMEEYPDTAEYEMNDAEHLVEVSADQELVDVDLDVDVDVNISHDQPVASELYADSNNAPLPSGESNHTIDYAAEIVSTDVASHTGEDHFMAQEEPHEEYLTVQESPSATIPDTSADNGVATTDPVPLSGSNAEGEPTSIEEVPLAGHDADTEHGQPSGEQKLYGEPHSSVQPKESALPSTASFEQTGSYPREDFAGGAAKLEDQTEAVESSSTEQQHISAELQATGDAAYLDTPSNSAADELSGLPPLPEGSDDGYEETAAEVSEVVHDPDAVAQDDTKDPHEISDGIYIDPPPPILLYLTSTDDTNLCIFNAPSRSGTPAAGANDSHDEQFTVLLQHQPTLYYDPLPALFDALRQEQAIAESFDIANCELVLDAFDLQLAITEVSRRRVPSRVLYVC